MKPEVPGKNRTRRYTVFLSYRHADNKEPGRQWATWLHQLLENYEIPSDLAGTANINGEVIPASLYPVFRDEEELPADADLTRNIREALENSALLVVICSPRAVQSRFVAEEIRYFKELGKADRILALMIDGEPNTAYDSAKQSSGLAAEMECLPEPLRRGVARNDGSIDWSARTEPIAADARPGGQPVQGWTNTAAYREQLLRDGRTEKLTLDSEIKSYEQRLELTKLKMVAGALGVPLGVLTRRDKAMQLKKARNRARALRRWLAAVALLAVLSVAGGILALKKQREAEQARIQEAKQRTLVQEQSEKRRRLLAEAARSDRLVAEEKLGRGESPAAFAYLARSIVYDGTSTIAAEKATAALNAWNFGTPLALCEHRSLVYSAQFSPDGEAIVTTSGASLAGITQIWAAQSGKLLATLRGDEGLVNSAQFSPNGQRIVTASDDQTARVWELQTGKLVATLAGHDGPVLSAQFSPDGRRIVTLSGHQGEGAARVWDAESAKLLTTIEAHGSQLNSVQFSPDGQRIVTAIDTISGKNLSGNEQVWIAGTAQVWEAKSGKLLITLRGDVRQVLGAQFSPDGERIITRNSIVSDNKFFGTAQVWEARSGKLLATLQGHLGPMNTAQFSPDGQTIVTASNADKTVRVWEAKSGKLLVTLEGHQGNVNSAHFSPDGQTIVTASDDKTARVWETNSGRLLAIFQGHHGRVLNGQFSPDAQRIVTASDDHTARVWEAKIIKLGVILQGHRSNVLSAQFSPDSQHIVTGSEDETARLWEAQSGKLLAILQGHEGFVEAARFSPDGQRIVTAALGDKTARVWEAQSGKLLTTLQGHAGSVNTAHFSPDGQRIVTASHDNTARVWEAKSGKQVMILRGDEDPVWDAQFSPDGRHIVTGSDSAVARVWDAQSAEILVTLGVQGGRVETVEFSPNGQRIVTLSRKFVAQVWETGSGELLATLERSNDAHFSPDSHRIVTASAATAKVCDAKNGEAIMTFQEHDRVRSAQFSPDGQRIVTASDDKTARICEAQSGRLVATLQGHEDPLNRAQFSPDGQRIVTASDDKTARVWTILPPIAGAPPSWFPDFLRYMAQQRLNPEGELQLMSPNEWLVLRDRLRQVVHETAAQDTPYLRILRHFVKE